MSTSSVPGPLKGESLAGRDLSGVDFSGSDLRGTDFSQAGLRGAVFRGARTGLTGLSVAARAALGVALGIASGFAASWTGAWIRHALQGPRPGLRVLALFVLSEIILYVVATLVWGASVAMKRVALPILAVIVLAAGLMVVGGLGATRDLGLAVASVICVALVALAIDVGAFARSAAQSGAGWLIWFVLLATVVGVRLSSGVRVAVVVAIVATLTGLKVRRGDPAGGAASSALRRTMTWGGTSFRGADLSDADFGEAHLRNTDFRDAKMDAVRWNEPLEVAFCRFDAGAPPPNVKRRTRTTHAKAPARAGSRGKWARRWRRAEGT